MLRYEALDAGGWFGEAHETQVTAAATEPDVPDGATAVRAPFVATVWQVGVEPGATAALSSPVQPPRVKAAPCGAPPTSPGC